MSTRIDVPGSFLFDENGVRFLFAGNGREINLSSLLKHDESKAIMLAILGVGFQNVTDNLPLGALDVKTPAAPTGPSEYIKSAEEAMARAVEDAERTLASVQEKFSDEAATRTRKTATA